MRFLSVADAARAVEFYRDVLGFAVRDVRDDYGMHAAVELVYGAARIQLTTHNGSDTAQRSRKILFFETDDLAAMREAVVARGGKPSEPEKVNWIKMQMFEVRDPDGHTLWFGQSFDEPEGPRPRRMMRTIMPELPLDNVPSGVAYYRDVLGFKVNYAQHDIGVMDRDEVRLLLIARTERHTGIASAYVYVEDVNALHAEFVAKGANVQGDPVSQPWGLREFPVFDLEGNQITFGQPFE
jgi:uncharacterized glyoxalase superfamily protein PhnB